jgi:radical SAM protein with 4Fe4S-binding SPASM domain
MTADKNITGLSAPSGVRIKLAEQLPLEAPLLVQVFNIYACNLSCKFCHHGLPPEKRPFMTTRNIMDFDLYKKCIDDMAQFRTRIKLLRFCGNGESLLDKNIVKMIRYAAERRVAQGIELITNATLLSREMSRELVASGLTRLRVSIYGVSSAKYKELSDVDVDFEQIVDNVHFFYDEIARRGKKVTLYVKTMDCALNGKEEETRFVELFSDHCDLYSVERVRPIVQGIDYSAWINDEGEKITNVLGIEVPPISVCPQPFHLLTICPDGRVVPCSCDYSIGVGNCSTQTLPEIWHGETLRRFQRMMLDGADVADEACSKCTIFQCRPFPEDILDQDAERLKIMYE